MIRPPVTLGASEPLLSKMSESVGVSETLAICVPDGSVRDVHGSPDCFTRSPFVSVWTL
jgi:hypothetical protein